MKPQKKVTEKSIFESAVLVEGLRYTESKEFSKYAKQAFDIYEKCHGKQPDKMFMSTMGHQLKQFADIQEAMEESTSIAGGQIPLLRDYGFELITALFPGLIANDLFNVQPAKFKNYSIFYQNYVHDTAKGQTAAASRMIGSLQADAIDTNYTRDAEVNRLLGTGNGSTANYTIAASILFRPLIANTVVITAVGISGNTRTIVDNGTTGALIGDIGSGTNTISYTTGQIDVTFVENIQNLSPVYLTYGYVGEGSTTNAMEMDMTISEIQGVAADHRLRFNFSIEGQFAYRQQFGRSMDADLLAYGVSDMKAEIDGDLILAGYASAASSSSAGSISWNRTPDAGVQYFYWREQFIDALHNAGNLIIKAAGFGEGNKVVGGLLFKQVIETIGPRVKLDNVGATVKGARKIGTVDGVIDCYYSPLMADNAFFVTYKGGPLQPGLSYNPYMPLYTSEPHMLDDGKLHRYLITSYGKLVVNSKLFVAGTLI